MSAGACGWVRERVGERGSVWVGAGGCGKVG